jgi:flagellar motility protein MotE (MotC chaperone)
MNGTNLTPRTGRKARLEPRGLAVSIFVASGLTLVLSPFLSGLSLVGALHASPEERQKAEERPAKTDADSAADLPEGMEAFRDLLEEEKVTREFVEAREREVERREKELAVLQNDLTEKFRRLELAKTQLQEMTQAVEEAREAQLAAAVSAYKRMPPEAAAREMNEMDLKLVVEILKRLTPPKAVGDLLAAMRKEVEKSPSGTESEEEKQARQAKLQRLRDLNEMFVDPVRANR